MTEASIPFRAGREGYASFRIPAVVATGAGTLLAFCEGRAGSARDHGNIDIVLKRSADGGRTWGPLQVAAANGDDLAGNPAPVVLDTGRVVVPGNHTVPPTGRDNGTEARYNSGHCLLSDDRGQTWYLGYVDENTDGYVNANETTAAELPDGRVYFNTRNDSPSPGNRADAHSLDGGRTLEKPFRPQAGLVTPVVQGSLLQLRDPDLLYSGPADPGFRALMTLRASADGGTTWRPVHTVDGLPAAYSDLVRVYADTVGLLYETGDFGAYETITFRRIPLTALT
jgi:sialidase-1